MGFCVQKTRKHHRCLLCRRLRLHATRLGWALYRGAAPRMLDLMEQKDMKSEENYRAEEIAEVKFLSRLVWSASSVQLGHLNYSCGGINIKVGPKKSL